MTEAVTQPNTRIFQEHLRELKDSYSGIGGNAINYIATLTEGYLDGTTESINAARAEAFSNVFTAIREHQTARTMGEDNYFLQWENTADGPKLKTQFGFLDDLFTETEQSAQLDGFEFEVPRNAQNVEFYHRLKKARASGYIGPMIELSPHPEMTQAARDRGYEGNDTVFIYTNLNGTEQIEQLWLEGQDWEQYRPLLQELADLMPERNHALEYEDTVDPLQSLPQDLNDIAIMRCSGRANSRAVKLLRDFAKDRPLPVLPPEQASILQDFILGDVQTKTRADILPLIELEAERIAKTGVFGVETDSIELIADLIIRQQYRIEEMISILRGEKDINALTRFDQLSWLQQDDEMRESNFVAKGCGISYAANRQSLSTAGFRQVIEVSSGSVLKIDDEAECPSCGWCFRVKNGDPSTYELACPSPFACPDRASIGC